MERYSNIHSSSGERKKHIKKYLGNYLGIVVQNNDPDQRGRIKIYVPHISATVYKNWNEVNSDKNYKFIGENIDSDLTKIIGELRQILPWAECAAPLVGGSSSGRYNAHFKRGTISDAARIDETEETDEPEGTKFELNRDGIGEKPGHIYEVNDLRVNDAYGDVSVSNTGDIQTGVPNQLNKHSYNYTPSTYSNRAKGSFSVPNVGGHVWVFFEGGDPMSPVYFATSFGNEDWKGIYDVEADDHGIDYPGAYENKEDINYNHNTETYRNKFVINQKGGTLEFVNTDNREILKMTHYSGSFKEFNNHTSIEFASQNDQKLVQADQFLTVRGHRNEYTDHDYDLIVRGDLYRKIGNFNKQNFKKWYEIVRKIGDAKQLFELKRARYSPSNNIHYQKTSPAQTKVKSNGSTDGSRVGHTTCPVCNDFSREKTWMEQYTPFNTFTVPIINASNTNVYTDGTTTFVGPNGNSLSAAYVQPDPLFSNHLGGGPCPVCNGQGVSPSSQNGDFLSEDKDTNLGRLLRDNIKDLTDIEKELGLGGSEIVNITKHKVETIGLLMNDLPSIRVDDEGKINKNEIIVHPEGVVTGQKKSPLIEYVHVDDLPGGSYSLNVCNRFNIQAGSGGVSFKSYGPVDIGGTITNITGEQINLVSENEVNIIADNRLNIVADILTLRQKKYKQVLVDSNLGVSQNVIIAGGLHVDGELTCQHITAPVEIQETERVKLYAKSVTGVQIGECVVGSGSSAGTWPVYGTNAADDCILCYDHSHPFKNVPLHLLKDSKEVRKVGKNSTITQKIGASPVENQKKGDPSTNLGETV